jgi:prefoldin subunit 5
MLSVVFPWLNNVPDDEKIAPIGVGYLVATKSGKSAEESYADALQKIHKKIPPQMERYLELN